MATTNKTKIELLNEALEGLVKYTKGKDADISVAGDYLAELLEWVDAPQTESSNPNDPPPPPPGHK